VRSYNVAVASLAIDAPIKWTDNVLSQHTVPGVTNARRGVARRIPHATLRHLALTRELHTELGLSVRDALPLARQLLSAAEGAAVDHRSVDHRSVHRGAVHLTVDETLLDRAIERRLRDALESAPMPSRGRPARRMGQ
jgi:hypothetical protein